MKRTLALTSAAALALGVAAIEPVEANPLLLVAPAASSGISAGWAAAAGLGGVLFGATIANPHVWNGCGYYGCGGYGYGHGYGAPYGAAYSAYAYDAYAPTYADPDYVDPGYGYAAPAYAVPAYRPAYHPSYHPAYADPGYVDPGYGYAAPSYAAPVYHPAYHAAYAAHAARHCHIGYQWLNGYQTAVRICVTPLY